ncbi:hypothetical protein ACLM5J_04870 [Nocardioides sp. Bht2]|uniref:hypothetical protein n=1 Tax=Nocardioides sp. Bht2 TaxID=3392297 RepID=UPI0039B6DEA1
MDLPAMLDLQSGVVARRQLLRAGLTESDLRRMLRRRELALLMPGVYLQHTGEPSWLQRAWGGVLPAWPAALCADSALRAWDGPGRRGHRDGDPIHVAIARDRRTVTTPGLVVHRLVHLDSKVLWNLAPPRLRIEEAALDVAAAAADDFAAIAVLAEAVGSRRTTAARIGDALAQRTRIRRRSFLAAVIADLEAGACSVLEHGYLHRVERAHGLPRSRRQVAALSAGRIYRDVVYVDFGQVVELDGRLDHTSVSARDRDLERDLDAALDGLAGIRLGWGQVFDRPCHTARRVGELLRRRGWPGTPETCPDCPPPR